MKSFPFLTVAAVVLLSLLRLSPAQVRFAPQVRGHLALATGSAADTELNALLFCDADGDGDRDLVSIRNFGAAELWRSSGDGVFSLGEPIAQPAFFGSFRRGAHGDIDGDGDPDLALVQGTDAGYTNAAPLRLRLNDGTGGFADAPAESYPGGSFLGGFVFLADADGDGDRDLIAAGQAIGGEAVWLWANDGLGRFADVSAQRLPPLLGPASFAALPDIDRDGDLDVLLMTTAPHLLVNDGTGAFTDHSEWIPPGGALAAAADVDGDGDIDLLRSSDVLLNDGTGTSYQVLAIGLPLGPEVTAADVDGDGRIDLLGASASGVPFVYRGAVGGGFEDASATWVPAHARLVPTSPSGFPAPVHCVEDVDRDGDPDLLVGGAEGRAFSSFTVGIPPKLLINSGRQRFVDGSQRSLSPAHLGTQAIAAGDADGDGDEDLFFAHAAVYPGQQDQEVLLLNDGDGTFAAAPPGALPSWPVSGPDLASAAAFVDVDRDGDLDLVTARGWPWLAPPGNVANRLALNDGTGRFVAAAAGAFPSLADASASVAHGDVDGDGDGDLVFGNQDAVFFSGLGAQNRLYLNDGSGVFTDATAGRLPAVLDATLAVVLADMDRDGDLDLVVGNGPYGSSGTEPGVALLLNDGSGAFTDASRVPPQSLLSALAVGDLDGDGDLDIALPGRDLRNDGTGRFVEVPSGTNPLAVRIVLADLDGDGAAERVEGNTGTLGIAGAVVERARQSDLRPIAVADIDQDDDLDVVFGTTGTLSPADDSLFALGVLRNQRRQASAPVLARIGHLYRLRFRAVNGASGSTAVAPLLGFGLLQPRFLLPGFGRFGLDPSLVIALPAVVVPDADTPAELALRIPLDLRLADATLATQAVFWPTGGSELRLSNVVVDRILR
jgi:hypothetical protein